MIMSSKGQALVNLLNCTVTNPISDYLLSSQNSILFFSPSLCRILESSNIVFVCKILRSNYYISAWAISTVLSIYHACISHFHFCLYMYRFVPYGAISMLSFLLVVISVPANKNTRRSTLFSVLGPKLYMFSIVLWGEVKFRVVGR